ncbi:hypothetical protein Vadar_032370 [Vaccinium darrowii]|uniref:Uncharacterized protein n=1 Tax=Vaccinium darrowii TaxID=229202 RepID=A0ACB7XDX7_9ERIC|nr:hypothetical protein Vadar_032370 [Vaccinium darrowii]
MFSQRDRFFEELVGNAMSESPTEAVKLVFIRLNEVHEPPAPLAELGEVQAHVTGKAPDLQIPLHHDSTRSQSDIVSRVSCSPLQYEDSNRMLRFYFGLAREGCFYAVEESGLTINLCVLCFGNEKKIASESVIFLSFAPIAFLDDDDKVLSFTTRQDHLA